MSLVNRTRLKELVGEINIAGDFEEAIEKEVERIVKRACERASANNRKTIMAKDL